MALDLATHGRRYAPEYPPYGHSDHLPMAWLALGALGASAQRREVFARNYAARLAPWPADDDGPRRIDGYLAAIAAQGLPAVLERELPALVSGWYREAYHPLIRLAYAVAFDVPEEAAAALAYLHACGSNPRLEALAREAPLLADCSGLELLQRATGWRVGMNGADSFTARAERVLAAPDIGTRVGVVADNLAQVSRAALDAFAATHDFFALHLVTASHAFRVLYPYAGAHADAVLNLGLLAGYVCIGAPPLERAATGPAGPADAQQLLALCADDEHDIKLAHSAWEQAAHFDDPAYLSVVAGYLTPTREM